MFRYRVIPCLLLSNNGLVKTVKFKSPRYIGDTINAVRIFNESFADELILLDITATKEKRIPPLNLISELSDECFMPFGVGGGIRKLDDVKKIIQSGAEKIIVNSYATENPKFVYDAAKCVGSQSIVVSLDVKKTIWGKYKVFRDSGKTNTGLDPKNFALTMQNNGAGEIFLNSIDRDGTFLGYDTELIEIVSEALTIPVIACGGARNISDFKSAIECGASGVSAGSLFVYQGKHNAVMINYPNRNQLKELFF